jgi:hypothetical protein
LHFGLHVFALTFPVAVHAITDPERRRRVTGTLQILADRISGDQQATQIAGRQQISCDLVVEDLEARAIAYEQNVAANVGENDGAHVADQFLEPEIAIDSAALHVDEVGTAALDTAFDVNVARDQRSAGKQYDIAFHFGACELARGGDLDVAVDYHGADVEETVRPLRACVAGVQGEGGECTRADDVKLGSIVGTHRSSLLAPVVSELAAQWRKLASSSVLQRTVALELLGAMAHRRRRKRARPWRSTPRPARGGCIMLESVRNLKTTEIELRQHLLVLESEWLVGRLLAKQGVATAEWVGNRRLLIEYDADLCSGAELIAFLQSCGVTAAVVRVGFAPSLFGSALRG